MDFNSGISGAMVEESCYAMKEGPPQSGREGDDANVIFEVAGVRSVQEWPQHMTDTKLREISMCVQSLSRLKPKYLWFFSSRWVSRDPGTDISRHFANLALP